MSHLPVDEAVHMHRQVAKLSEHDHSDVGDIVVHGCDDAAMSLETAPSQGYERAWRHFVAVLGG